MGEGRGRLMHTKAVVFVIALITFSLVAVSFSTPVKAANWKPITTITGSGSQTTSEFMVNGSEWRIRWSYVPDAQAPDLSVFSFFVYPHAETSAYVGRVIQYGSEQTSGTLNLSAGTGLHYIEVVATNNRGYTINVEYNTESITSGSFVVLVVGIALGVPIILIIVISVLIRKRVKKRRAELLPPPP
jgi:hypothetical protein